MSINYREINQVAPNIPRAAFVAGASKGKQRTYHTMAFLIWAATTHGDKTPFSAREAERSLNIAHKTSRNATLWLEAAGFLVRTSNRQKGWMITDSGIAVLEEAKALFAVMYSRTAKRYLRMSGIMNNLAICGAVIDMEGLL